MESIKFLFIIILMLVKTFSDVKGGCTLSLRHDFGLPSPVFLYDNKYLSPDDKGNISLQRSETITIGCPGHKVVLSNSTQSYDVLEAHCVGQSTFRVERWIGEFRNIRCSGAPKVHEERLPGHCHRQQDGGNSGIKYAFGYKLKRKFSSLYEVCFDNDLLNSHYAQHTLSPTSRFMQTGTKRPQFSEGSLFGKTRMSKIYKVENQKVRLNEILGNKMSEQYITKKQFMTRGHLSPRADFTLEAETRATFHYANAAPQWQRGNAGDWAALEDALRRRVQTLGRSVSIRTGTHGVLTLDDAKSRAQHIYLHADDNNNLLVPVPLYFYKIVYDAVDKKATAFITINSSYYNNTVINDLTFCDDVCEDNPKFSWLKWRANDGTFSFCCEYEDFINEVKFLDPFEVTGLFY